MSTINEKISAWFEPRPELANIVALDIGYSAGGFWFKRLDPASTTHDHIPWQAVHDYDTDEAANARLLEEAKIHLWPTDGSPGGPGWAATSYAHLETRTSTDRPIVNFHADRKTAVVLAFCKFAGIEA